LELENHDCQPYIMSAVAKLAPIFPWDYVVPDNAFWDGITESESKAFVTCFTPEEIEAMTLDCSQPRETKLQRLRSILADTLATREADAAPLLLRDVDHGSWRSLKGGVITLDRALGTGESEEATALYFYENGANDGKDMSALLWLADIFEREGKYGAAETRARQGLDWISGLEKLGPDSPQALGCMRLLVNSTWKQEKYVEAEEWIAKCTDSIERLGRGKFAKYQEEEVVELERVVKALEKQRAGLGAAKG